MGPHFPGRRGAHRNRLRLRADAGNGFYGEHQIRLLRIYLGITTCLYTYGVVFGNLIPVHPGLARENPVGGIAAVLLGLAALASLAVRPDEPAPATAVAIGATPAVMVFHHAMTAEFACLIAPMFLAMYLRAFYSPRRGTLLVGVLTGACVLALALSQAASLYLDYIIFAIAIVGAAESFGLVTRTLVAAACTDPLTGLLNRAGWEIATADLLARSRPRAVTVTVIAADIDNFKQINDTDGHLAGDEHLIRCAARWRDLAPRGTVLARLGGDEFGFCVVDRAGPVPDAAERFVAAIRLHTPDTSVGTASRSAQSADIAALHAAADASLYAAKRRKVSGARLDDRAARG